MKHPFRTSSLRAGDTVQFNITPYIILVIMKCPAFRLHNLQLEFHRVYFSSTFSYYYMIHDYFHIPIPTLIYYFTVSPLLTIKLAATSRLQDDVVTHYSYYITHTNHLSWDQWYQQVCGDCFLHNAFRSERFESNVNKSHTYWSEK